MEIVYVLIAYLLFVNILGATLFCLDKYLATKNKNRIPEKTLHILEFAGAAFFIVVLMFVIRHKNRKFSYYIISFTSLIVWIVLICFFIYFFPEFNTFEIFSIF